MPSLVRMWVSCICFCCSHPKPRLLDPPIEHSFSWDLSEPDAMANELMLSELPVESGGGISSQQIVAPYDDLPSPRETN